jgi:hypothetical protein
MAAERLSRTDLSECEGGEVEEVLAALRDLARKVSSPTIRVCLDSAHDDIAYLVGTGEECEESHDAGQ